MRRLAILLAFVVTVLLAISGYLLSQLRRERERVLAEVKSVAALRADLARLVETRARLEDQVRTLRLASRRLAGAGAAGALATVGIPGGGLPPTDMLGAPRPFEPSPEQRNLMVRQRYGAVLRELALSEPQIEALLPVLAAQDLAEGMWRPSNDRAAASQRTDPARDRAEIAAIVGAEKAAQFETLKKSLLARSQLSMLRMSLDETGEPMSDEQHQKLLAIMSAREPQSPPTPVEGEPGEQTFKRFRNWLQERDRQLREDAASVLTPQQQRRLDEMNALQAAMRAASTHGLGLEHRTH